MSFLHFHFRPRVTPLPEGRLLHFSPTPGGDIEGAREHVRKELQASTAREQEEAKKGGAERQRIAAEGDVDAQNSVFNKTKEQLVKHAADIQKLPPTIGTVLEENLARFLRNRYLSYDRNHDQITQRSEFDLYQEDMTKRIDDVFARYVKQPNENAAKQEEGKRKMDQAAAGAEEAARKIQEVPAADKEEFDPAKLADITGLNGEVRKFHYQQSQFQTQGQELSKEVAEFREAYDKFEEGKKSFAGGNTTMGILNTIPQLRPFTMFFGRGNSVFGIEFKKDEETDKMRAAKEKILDSAETKMKTLEEKKQKLAAYGRVLEGGPDQVTRGQEQIRDKGLRDLEESEKNLKQQEEAGGKQREAALAQRATLEKQRGELSAYQQNLMEQRDKATQARQQAFMKRDQMERSRGMLSNSLTQIQAALNNPNLQPEQRTALEEQQKKMGEYQASVDEGLQGIQNAAPASQQAEGNIEQAQNQVTQSMVTVEDHLNTVITPTLAGIEVALRNMEVMRVGSIPSQRKQLLDNFSQYMKQMQGLREQIADTVLEGSMSNDKLMSGLQESHKWLKSVEIKPPGVWDTDPIAWTFGKLGEGIQWCSKKAFEEGVFALSGFVKEQADKWLPPGLNWLVKTAVNITWDLPFGLLEAAVGLIGGIGTLIAHPIDALKGLGGMIGRDPKTGEWSWGTAGHSWGALIGWEHLSKGEIGRGVGHAALNVILTFTGAGAVATGAGVAAKAAGYAGRLAALAEAMGQASLVGKIAITAQRVGLYGMAVAKHPLMFGQTFARELVVEGAKNAGSFITGIPGGIVDIAQGIARLPGRIVGLGRSAIDEAALTGRIAGLDAQAAKAAAKAENIVINGKKLSDVGLTLEDVTRLSKTNPARLEELFGVSARDAGGLRKILKLEEAAAETIGLRSARTAVQTEKIAMQDAAQLEKYNKMNPAQQAEYIGRMQGLEGAELSKFITEFKPGPRLVQTKRGDFFLINAEGKAEIVHIYAADGKVLVEGAERLSNLVDEIAAATGRSKDAVRIEMTEQILGRSLSKGEAAGLIRAHSKPGVIGEMDIFEKVAKGKENIQAMKKAYMEKGFTAEEAQALARRDAQIAMDHGMAGATRKKIKYELNDLQEILIDKKPFEAKWVDGQGVVREAEIRWNAATSKYEMRKIKNGVPEQKVSIEFSSREARVLKHNGEFYYTARPRKAPGSKPAKSAVLDDTLDAVALDDTILAPPGSAPAKAPVSSPLASKPAPGGASPYPTSARQRAASDRCSQMTAEQVGQRATECRTARNKLQKLVDETQDPVLRKHYLDRAARAEEELKAAEMSIARRDMNKATKGENGKFRRPKDDPTAPIQEGAAVQVEEELTLWQRATDRTLTRKERFVTGKRLDAGWECLGVNDKGEMLVGRWNSAKGKYETGIMDASAADVQFARRLRDTKTDVLRARRDTLTQQTSRTAGETQELAAIEAELRHKAKLEPVKPAPAPQPAPGPAPANGPASVPASVPASPPPAAPKLRWYEKPDALDNIFGAHFYDKNIRHYKIDPRRWGAEIAEPWVRGWRKAQEALAGGSWNTTAALKGIHEGLRNIPIAGWPYSGATNLVHWAGSHVASYVAAPFRFFTLESRLARAKLAFEGLDTEVNALTAGSAERLALERQLNHARAHRDALQARWDARNPTNAPPATNTPPVSNNPPVAPASAPANLLKPTAANLADMTYLEGARLTGAPVDIILPGQSTTSRMIITSIDPPAHIYMRPETGGYGTRFDVSTLRPAP